VRQRDAGGHAAAQASHPTRSVFTCVAVRKLAGYLRRPPDTATVEDLRNFQLQPRYDRGTSPIHAQTPRSRDLSSSSTSARSQRVDGEDEACIYAADVTVVLSREEVSTLIAACRNLKHQTALSVAYGAGLRASEVISLKVGDIDSTRMTLRIQQGKGGKDRYAMLSPVMLERAAHVVARRPCPGKMLDGGWLFPGPQPG